MFNVHNFVKIFIIFAACVLLFSFFKGAYVDISVRQNNNYKQYLESACESALAASDINERNVFLSEVTRKDAVNAFFHTLEYGMNKSKEMIQSKVPFIFLVDTDGYYVVYQEEYRGNDGGTYHSEVITPINTWTKRYNAYMVRFSLDDVVYVTNNVNNVTFQGAYYDVYEEMGYPNSLAFMATEEDFDSERTDAIINTVEDSIMYYLNNYNIYDNEHGMTYDITLVKTEDSGTAQQKLSQPTVISFLQGPVNHEVNIFAFVGCERIINKVYYLTEENSIAYYHEKTCDLVSEGCNSFTMEQCAKLGARPCECVR